MKVKQMIKALQKLNQNGEVWIDDEQGRRVLANEPSEIGKEAEDWELESENGETLSIGDVTISFENT